MDTREILEQRNATHGDYTDHARITQEAKRAFYGNIVSTLDDCQKEAVDMIIHKLGRIGAGNPNFKDHWDDIAGYATLVSDRIQE